MCYKQDKADSRTTPQTLIMRYAYATQLTTLHEFKTALQYCKSANNRIPYSRRFTKNKSTFSLMEVLLSKENISVNAVYFIMLILQRFVQSYYFVTCIITLTYFHGWIEMIRIRMEGKIFLVEQTNSYIQRSTSQQPPKWFKLESNPFSIDVHAL